jgi:tight adherence protein C
MTTSLAVLAGMLLAAGIVSGVVAWLPHRPQLAAALDLVSPDDPAHDGSGQSIGEIQTRSERLGAWAYRLVPLHPNDRQRRALRQQERTVADFYGDKAALALTGCLFPLVVGLMLVTLAGLPIPVPPIAALIGAVLGFFVPDLQLLQSADRARTAAAESLLVYIDLVTLERLANASATQALHNAAQVSDVPLFVQLRAALARARLEQQAPYAELRRLADDLVLPELKDVADVMQLDESGAALSGTLRARVRELRDAHLTREHVATSASVEGMTIYMTIPAIIFGAIFMAAALLKIMAS